MKVTDWIKHPVAIKKIKGESYIVSTFHCPEIKINSQCKLHGKKIQPYVCQHFPMVHDDGVYLYIKKYCGYKFDRVEI